MPRFVKFLIPFIIFFSSFSLSDDTPISHAPIGIMGDHAHEKGETMFSLRISTMKMKGNLLNGNSIEDSQVLTLPNPNAGMLNAPSNLSIVPQEMDMRMIMLGGMFATKDRFTLMGMMMFKDLEMLSKTYQGMMNRNLLGSFSLSSEALSQVSLFGLINIKDNDSENSIFKIGFIKATGDNNKTDIVLTPMNSQMEMIMPYGMQGSDKSTKLSIGYTHKKYFSTNSLGFQIQSSLNTNEKDWAFGNKYETSIWFQKFFNNNLSWSLRYNFVKEESIKGSDSRITGPVQTANPYNYGGSSSSLGIGFNTVFNLFESAHSDRLAIEILFPINQSKTGLQMDNKEKIILGYQKAF